MPKRNTGDTQKQGGEQALPSFMDSIVGETRERIGQPEPPQDAEQMMIDFAQSEVWKLIKGWMDEMRTEYDNALAGRSAQPGTNLEEVGFRYLVANEVKHALDSLETSITMAYDSYVARLETEGNDKPVKEDPDAAAE